MRVNQRIRGPLREPEVYPVCVWDGTVRESGWRGNGGTGIIARNLDAAFCLSRNVKTCGKEGSRQ